MCVSLCASDPFSQCSSQSRGGQGGGGPVPAHHLHMQIKQTNTAALVNVNNHKGPQKKDRHYGSYPSLPYEHAAEEGGPPPHLEGAHNASPLIAQDAAPGTAAPAATPGAPDPTRVTARHRSLISRAAACCTRSANGIRNSLCATLACSILILLGILLLRELGWFIIHNGEGKIDRNEDDIDL